jgi:tetratricopeptide (TPR) repeat protein
MSRADELRDKGIELFHQYDYESAARTFQQAREAYAEAGRNDMVAEMKVNIGLVHRSLGETQQALEMMKEALNMFRDTGDELREAQVLGNIGGVYSALGETEQAELSYRRAAGIFRDNDRHEMYADTMMALGTMLFKQGQFSNAAVAYQVALERKENPKGTQKILKMLVNLVNKIIGNPSIDETTSSQSGSTENNQKAN